jgi:drug/metabolite transporter (DMT)-like permease
MSPKNKALLLLHFIVFIWGFTGILGREISIPAIPLVGWRTLIAAISLCLFMAFNRVSFATNKKNLLRYALVGALTAAHWICFFGSIKASNVSTALAVISTTSFFVAFLSPLILRTKFVKTELLLGLLVVIGLALIFEFEPQYKLGIVLSLCAALLAAVFSTLNSKYIKTDDPIRISFYELSFAAGFVMLFQLCSPIAEHHFVIPSAYNFVLLLLLGVVATAFAFVQSVKVMRLLSPFTCALTINLEPVYAILMALWIYGESEYMRVEFYFGTIILMGTLIVHQVIQRKNG